MVVMDRLRRARPNVLEQVLRANLLAMIGRLSGLLDTLVRLVRFADMTSLVTSARTSLVAARVTNPRDRIRSRIAHHREMNLPR